MGNLKEKKKLVFIMEVIIHEAQTIAWNHYTNSDLLLHSTHFNFVVINYDLTLFVQHNLPPPHFSSISSSPLFHLIHSSFVHFSPDSYPDICLSATRETIFYLMVDLRKRRSSPIQIYYPVFTGYHQFPPFQSSIFPQTPDLELKIYSRAKFTP